MTHRKAARVLPDPVGARIRVCSPRLMAAQPCSWAGVGTSNVAVNHVRVSGENRSSDGTMLRLEPQYDNDARGRLSRWSTFAGTIVPNCAGQCSWPRSRAGTTRV